jgi:hypothetical protein
MCDDILEAIRKIIDSELLESFMELPEQMTNCKVEIIVLPVSKTETHVSNTHSMKGFLKNYANPALIEQEKTAWEINVKEKYDNL